MLYGTKGDKQKGNWLFVPASELLNLRLTSHLLKLKRHIFLMEAIFASDIHPQDWVILFIHIKRIQNYKNLV